MGNRFGARPRPDKRMGIDSRRAFQRGRNLKDSAGKQKKKRKSNGERERRGASSHISELFISNHASMAFKEVGVCLFLYRESELPSIFILNVGEVVVMKRTKDVSLLLNLLLGNMGLVFTEIADDNVFIRTDIGGHGNLTDLKMIHNILLVIRDIVNDRPFHAVDVIFLFFVVEVDVAVPELLSVVVLEPLGVVLIRMGKFHDECVFFSLQ